MNWDRLSEETLAVLHQVCSELREPIEEAARALTDCIKVGGKVLICGNGGSAADAQHFSAELLNRFLRERRPYPGLALTTDSSVLTAIANDYAFDRVFAKQVEGLGRPGDILIAISTSGNARNVLAAVEAAGAGGMASWALTGGTGGALASAADHSICISCTNHVPRIQEGHGLIIHILCERIEEMLL